MSFIYNPSSGGGGGTPGGSDTQVQYNDAGTFAGSANFVYDDATNTVGFGNLTGTALNLIAKNKEPSITEDAGNIVFTAASAAKANSNGGSILFQTGFQTGVGIPGDMSFFVPGGVSLSLTSNGISLVGPANVQFVAQSGGFAFLGGNDDGAELNFTAAYNFGFTENRPMNFSTDSGLQIAITESPLGSPAVVIGTANAALGFYAAGPVVQATTAVASAVRTAVASTNIQTADTFDGYTMAQVVKILRNVGLMA